MEIKKFFKQIFSDPGGGYSSKRSVVLLGVVLITVGYLSNLFFDYTVERFMFESIMYIVIAGFGISGAEKFAPKYKNKETNDSDA